LGFVYGLTRPVLPAASQTALLVQGNVDPIRRFTSGTAGDLEVYQNLSRQTGPNTLVVWPEAAVSVTDVRQSRVPRLVSGAYDFVGARDRLNLVLGFENGQERGRTSKTRFVPFGETFPLREPLDFVYAPIFQGMGLGTGFGRVNPEARLGQRLIVMGADRVGGYVCYDSGFPEVTRNLVRLGANILAESTNDGWFGGGTGNWQHFVIDRMRAIETDRFVLRAANTGVTALIDPRGRVVNNLPINRPGALPVRYARLETITPFVQFGDWAVILATALIPVMAWWGRQERRLL
jgi:apolipoprotein N-acyltransferase